MSLRTMGRRAATFAGRSFKGLAAAAALGLAAFGVVDHAAAGITFTGQHGAGNTWNVYERINTPMSFKEALAFTPTRSDPTGGTLVGHLVTLGGLTENNFVYNTAGSVDSWIGLSDRVGVAPGASESQFAFDPLHEGWAWVTGEPFTFENWQRDAGGIPTEPNNSGGTEDAAHMWGGGFWNDNASGFGLNDPAEDMITFDSPAEGQAAMGFVIEWETRLASQPMGFPGNRPDPPQPLIPRVFATPLARLPGQDGTATTFGVTDKTGTGASVDTRDAITRYLSATGTLVNGSSVRFDIHDPQNGGAQGSIAGPQVPIPSDTAADDNNFQEVVKGTFQVPAGQGGNYTFNVRSDDGFAMRIISQPTGGSLTQHPFTAVRTGRLDEDGSLVFLAPTGDSNTQGLINLAPGTYDVEFIWFENGGGAFAEVSTAKGDFVGSPAAGAQWILLGDGSTKPELGPFNQPARLSGNVTVKNYPRGSITNVQQIVADFRTNPTPAAEGMFDDAILYDGDDICCGRPAAGLAPSLINEFPNGGPDQFTTAMTGSFQVFDTDGAAGEMLTFGLFADDNAGLHIIGQSFTGVADFTGDGAATLTNPEGGADQWLVADYRTGNTNAFGLITLTEGVTYNFESFMLEEGGDSGLEVWVAAGNQLATGFDPARFFPLTAATLPGVVLSANTGLPLVMGPGTGPSAGLEGDFNGDGKVDAADYVVWRKTDGTQAGYNLWRMNFGRTSGSGSVASAVPEPASALLVALGLIGGAIVARRRAN